MFLSAGSASRPFSRNGRGAGAVSPPPVPVQNRPAVLSDGFPALQLPIDRRCGNAQPSGNVRRARVRLIQCGNLSPARKVRKIYVFVMSRHLLPLFLDFPSLPWYKKINAIEPNRPIRGASCSFAFNITTRIQFLSRITPNICLFASWAASTEFPHFLAALTL